MNPGILYIVATPLGNLGDISDRARQTLAAADRIACEDTRVTKNLLTHFGIDRPTMSYHQHSGPGKVREIGAFLAEGQSIALVTDAGTPGISDPGNLLISELLKKIPGLRVIPIPGACAAVAALSISGFPTDKFLFLGFPPHKNKRQKFFREIAASPYTIVFYESGHRIKKCLAELTAVLEPERKVVVCRELTKKFETIYRGTANEVVEKMSDERGEFTVIVGV